MTDSSNTPVRRHVLAWLVALVLAFVLGYLLALRHPLPMLAPPPPACPSAARPPAGTKDAGSGMHGGAGSGVPGTPSHFGGGDSSGTGTVSGNGAQASGSGAPASVHGSGSGDGDVPGGGKNHVDGNVLANGSSSSAVGGGGEIDNGGGDDSGHSPLAVASSAPDITPPPATSASSGSWVPAPAGTTLSLGAPDAELGVDASKPAGKVVTALDYRYDKSGLPHYPNALKVASGTDAAALAAAAGPATKNFSVTEIVTDDTPAIAAAWYHDHLPAGWNELAMPSAPAMDQAIAQSKTPQPGQSPVDALINQMIAGPQLEREKPGVDAARAAGLTIFQPPDQNVDHRMIIVIKDRKTGKTAVLLMKKDAS